MAGPLIVLYEVSIVGAKIFGKKRVQQKDEDAEKNNKEQGQGN